MNFQENLKKYAHLIVKSGVDLQKGQELVISAPVEANDFARMIAKEAYEAGAREVIIQYSDEKASRMKYDYCDMDVFENPPQWFADSKNHYAERNAAFVTISASDPDLMKGIDPKKAMASTVAMHKMCKPFYDKLDVNGCAWNIISVPTKAWAKKVFPDKSEAEAIDAMWDAIFKAVRVYSDDPVKAWEEHHKSFVEKVNFLNEKQFVSFRYENSIGTNITLGMPENHIWIGGGDELTDGRHFFPNMPTEEIFSAPHKDKINGTVHSALPLNYQGNLIDDFSITYKDGRVVDYDAKVGKDVLKSIIDTDEGSLSLGEIALIPHNSPISNMGILFYNTLYDENASCHFAIGSSYSSCIKGGTEMSKDELKANGMNDSVTHVDFMLGTADLKITATDRDGNETPIFINGNWAE